MEYLVDLNGIQAVIVAGYAADSAAAEASRLLRNAKVADAIDAAMAQRAWVTRTFIIHELAPSDRPKGIPLLLVLSGTDFPGPVRSRGV